MALPIVVSNVEVVGSKKSRAPITNAARMYFAMLLQATGILIE